MSNYQSSNMLGGLQGFGDLQNQQTFTLPNTNYIYPSYDNSQYIPHFQTYQYSTFVDKTEQALNVLKKLKALGKIDFDNVDDFIETLEEVKNAI